MPDRIIETREEEQRTDGGVVRDRVVRTDSTNRTYSMAERVVGLITGLVLSLLAIRFLLSMLGANRANPFAEFIYSLTYPLVAPFFGLFGYTMQYGVARIEFETLVAILVYALLGYGISRLLSLGRTV